VFVASMGLPPVCAQMDTIETRSQRTDLPVAPARLHVLPMAEKGLDLDEEERQRIEVVLDSSRLTGFALSVGAVWWTARAVRVVASLLNATPAWRHVDPPPVLGRDEEAQEGWDDAHKDDNDKKETSIAPPGFSKSARPGRDGR
jgi:hypothetical protein